jgi:hypothetical protein
MFQVREFTGNTFRTLTERASFAAAKAYVETLGVSFMEDDADHEGCADAFLTDGRIVAIQPVGFKL